MTQSQKRFAAVLRTHSTGWHGFASDRQTVETVCSFANLGIIALNTQSQFRLVSQKKLDAFSQGEREHAA